MKRGFALSMAVCLIISLGFYSIPHAETYTLDQCIEVALQNNYGVIAAENSYDDARIGVYSAWGGLLPTISVSSGGSRSWAGFTSFDQSSGRVISGGITRDSYSGSLNFRSTYLGLGLYNYANIKKRRSDRASSYYNLSKSQKDLILGVKGNYYDLLKAKILLEVAEDAVKRGEERLRVVQTRYELGSASMSDVLKAKVQFGNDKLDRVSRASAYGLAEAQLAFTMGIDVNSEFDVDENLPDRDINISFEDALSEALSGNPEYRKAHFDLSSAKSLKTMAYSNFLPSLTLGLSHSTNVDNFSQLTDFKQLNASSFMYATISFNIFNGASDYANLRSAKNAVNTYKENLENTQNSVALEIKKSFLDLERAKEAKVLAGESVAAAQEDLNLVKEKYNLGAATILEVLDAEVSFKQAQTNHIEVQYNYNLAVSQLEKALGR